MAMYLLQRKGISKGAILPLIFPPLEMGFFKTYFYEAMLMANSVLEWKMCLSRTICDLNTTAESSSLWTFP